MADKKIIRRTVEERIKEKEEKIKFHKEHIERLEKEIELIKNPPAKEYKPRGKAKSDKTKIKELAAELANKGLSFEDFQKMIDKKK